ncbi:uncharacterized protein KY384_001696 [Bacidia gigantensis]|uniref:uncharacterized protein n=1 Tax=Bacidia gigantensis TaxID=2732470 RepID=UPI001D058B0E|nr:uncharacterized protein KY384_001696 [Bacidia gigantensis]KAG8533954.1 hypothetical protein KY384_001696 [Bacidia gigantensis]
MYLLSTLLLASSLVTLILALPGVALLQQRKAEPSPTGGGSPTQGVWGFGVTCETGIEPAHTLDAESITQTINQALTSYQLGIQEGEAGLPNYVGWPKNFHLTDQLGNDADGHPYSILAAPGCDLQQDLLYAPIAYPGATAPASFISATIRPPPGGNATTVIVLFQAPDPNGPRDATGLGWVTNYCAVLTNSDAEAGEQIWVGGLLNPSPGGFHQCNDAQPPPGVVQPLPPGQR